MAECKDSCSFRVRNEFITKTLAHFPVPFKCDTALPYLVKHNMSKTAKIQLSMSKHNSTNLLDIVMIAEVKSQKPALHVAELHKVP